jgi:hypothetical protein
MEGEEVLRTSAREPRTVSTSASATADVSGKKKEEESATEVDPRRCTSQVLRWCRTAELLR